ncbi:GDP-mannose transporter GONST1 [Auxenochlorella protothecoides]|uniref:GDP-mannose transporter GONST1 n=1 Tax=Auxenochlorella protothecoides TaxID=3075 RepID=A0A087SEJ4_AUXPR|nr:GDP-mannose transporter GONST1 [Auxenochlorella protothecoides]KFM24148.1 GDP-mannose transporter GONST1 [Auxenochlorella protothecoides]RMZ52307.1 hypothetical protein APUTEX25_005060 [Auxenochlorella protothecoides]|eukprot:RMZ52307.1 hypothetical protein APUTEX25_005060 [Auxenochlorella protothecoides]
MAPGSAREEVPLLPGQAPRAGHGVDGIVDIDLSRKIYRTAPLGVPASLLAGTLYCIASMSMVLLNKVALSSFSFASPNALLFFQCALCVVATRACHAAGLITLEPLSARIVRAWLPVNLLFVAMIGTSFWALASLNVAMATVLKNLTNLFTLGGDYVLHGRTYGAPVLGCMALMAVSALCSALTDLSFNARGYAWQMANCAATAAYSLALRGTMDKIAPLTVSGRKMDEFSMVFYNNLLSLPFIALLMAASGEAGRVWSEPDLGNPAFMAVAALSGLIGFGISFTSLWFISTTTATIYSLVGSLNKVPLALIGLLAFNAPWTPRNLASILVGLAAGAVFALAKSRGPATGPGSKA